MEETGMKVTKGTDGPTERPRKYCPMKMSSPDYWCTHDSYLYCMEGACEWYITMPRGGACKHGILVVPRSGPPSPIVQPKIQSIGP